MTASGTWMAFYVGDYVKNTLKLTTRQRPAQARALLRGNAAEMDASPGRRACGGGEADPGAQQRRTAARRKALAKDGPGHRGAIGKRTARRCTFTIIFTVTITVWLS
jgi:hypothetical protein